MGIDTTYPVKANAHSSFRFPNHFRNVKANRSAAPETSRMRTDHHPEI